MCLTLAALLNHDYHISWTQQPRVVMASPAEGAGLEFEDINKRTASIQVLDILYKWRKEKAAFKCFCSLTWCLSVS